jgi:hypothetical protein
MKNLILILIASFISFAGFTQVNVKGYYRSNGTYVKPHVRTAPDSNPYNNYSYPGNYNPNTSSYTTGNSSTYLNNYYKTDSYNYTPSTGTGSYNYNSSTSNALRNYSNQLNSSSNYYYDPFK